MSDWQMLISVGILMVGTMLTRFLPYLCFPSHRQPPEWIVYLGKVLPYAVIGLLLVYCVKGVNFTSVPFGLPELAGIAVTGALRYWKENTFLSITAGTGVYMLLSHFAY